MGCLKVKKREIPLGLYEYMCVYIYGRIIPKQDLKVLADSPVRKLAEILEPEHLGKSFSTSKLRSTQIISSHRALELQSMSLVNSL